jgi:hypothetical protein
MTLTLVVLAYIGCDTTIFIRATRISLSAQWQGVWRAVYLLMNSNSESSSAVIDFFDFALNCFLSLWRRSNSSRNFANSEGKLVQRWAVMIDRCGPVPLGDVAQTTSLVFESLPTRAIVVRTLKGGIR